VDRGGNVWANDSKEKDGKGQQVFKFNTDGKGLMTLGKGESPAMDQTLFNRPSGVAIAVECDSVGDGTWRRFERRGS